MLIVWGLALLISFGLRLWGLQHPSEFLIRPSLIWILLFGPSLFLGLWLSFSGQIQKDN